MEYGSLLLVLAGAGALFMAFNNGANDVANAFASAVGARAITIKQAVLIAGLMNLLGAVLIGGTVSAKLITGILHPAAFEAQRDYVIAMFAVLVAAGSFVLFSTFARIPVSSSHAIVGALVGVSVAAVGFESVDWRQLYAVVLSWIVSPLLAGALSYALLRFIHRRILASDRPMERLRFWLPYVIAVTVVVFVLILLKGVVRSAYEAGALWQYGLLAAVLLPYATLAGQGLLRSFTLEMPETRDSAESVFQRLQVGTSSYVAFASGANDVANAISPVFAVYLVVVHGGLPTDALVQEVGVPLWILVLGGAGIATGIAVLGHRVIETLSDRITRLDNFKGFSVDFAAATTVVSATLLGLPVSSTHAATGAVVGTGVMEGRGVDVATLGRILLAWLATVPVAGVIAIVLYRLLRLFFGG